MPYFLPTTGVNIFLSRRFRDKGKSQKQIQVRARGNDEVNHVYSILSNFHFAPFFPSNYNFKLFQFSPNTS